MPNFHSDVLAIAANEENMCKVLARFGMNLAANKEYTDFDMRDLEGLETAKELYYEVGPQIDANYIFAFAGAPVPEDIAKNATPGWTSSTSSEGGFMAQLQAMMQATNQFNENAPEGTSLGLSVTAPTGRGVSDTATVGFTRYGQNWLLTICYDTAWCPNSEDLDVFFMGLPEGDYGVAFYDADEGDDYEEISIFSGLHHGCNTMHAIEGDWEWDTIENSDLKARKHDYAGVSRAGITDLAELAKIGATCSWSEWGWEDDDDEDYYDEEDYGSDDGDETVSFWDRPSVNWANPKEKDLRKIDGLIMNAMSSFPWTHRCDCGFTSKGNEAVELLFPGDDVKVVSDWTSAETPGKVMFKVYDAKGTAIGGISSWMNLYVGYEENQSSSAALASLLPHLRTTVWELTPGSLRKEGVDDPTLSIRFDLEPVDIDTLIAETHALLEKDRKERSLSSKGGM